MMSRHGSVHFDCSDGAPIPKLVYMFLGGWVQRTSMLCMVKTLTISKRVRKPWLQSCCTVTVSQHYVFVSGVMTCSWSGWPFFVVIDRAQSPQRPERWRKMWFSRVVWYLHGNFPALPNGHLLDSTSDLAMEIPSNIIYISYLFQMAIVDDHMHHFPPPLKPWSFHRSEAKTAGLGLSQSRKGEPSAVRKPGTTWQASWWPVACLYFLGYQWCLNWTQTCGLKQQECYQ